MRTRDARNVADLAAVFGHPLRVAILDLLADEPRSVGLLVDGTGAEQARVSKQLALLKGVGLLRCSPEGRCRVYSLSDADRVRAVLSAFGALGRSAAVKRSAACAAEVRS